MNHDETCVVSFTFGMFAGAKRDVNDNKKVLGCKRPLPLALTSDPLQETGAHRKAMWYDICIVTLIVQMWLLLVTKRLNSERMNLERDI